MLSITLYLLSFIFAYLFMKKLILLLITITTFVNVSYASFPVTDGMQNEVIQITDEEPNTGGLLFDVLSVLLSLLSVLFIFLFIGSGFSHNGNPFPYLLLTIASVFATIFFAKEARKRGAKRSNSFIGISILIISLLLIKFLIF